MDFHHDTNLLKYYFPMSFEQIARRGLVNSSAHTATFTGPIMILERFRTVYRPHYTDPAKNCLDGWQEGNHVLFAVCGKATRRTWETVYMHRVPKLTPCFLGRIFTSADR